MLKEAGRKSTKERSGEDYLAEVRRFIEENGRAPQFTSRLIGTPEYQLRGRIQFQVNKGRFSSEEKKQLRELLNQTGAGGERKAASRVKAAVGSSSGAAGTNQGDCNRQTLSSAPPETPRSRPDARNGSSVRRLGSASGHRIRGKRPAPGCDAEDVAVVGDLSASAADPQHQMRGTPHRAVAAGDAALNPASQVAAARRGGACEDSLGPLGNSTLSCSIGSAGSASEAGGKSTKERSGEEYLAELRRFIQENGRAPRFSSQLVGTTEYKLRAKIKLQSKKGRFSNKEKMELTELLHQTGAGGEANAASTVRAAGGSSSGVASTNQGECNRQTLSSAPP